MIHLGDICKINGAEIEPVWCITGGSPCQDLSIAGKRAGLAGARSGLFMEQVRIVKEMREEDKRNGRTGDMVRPRYLVWENVVGAFSSNKGKDFAAVLEEIIKIIEPEAPGIEVPEKGWPTWGGYHDEVGGRWSVVWRTHDAQYWGVPQRRRRISVVADFGGDTASEIQFDSESLSGDIAESGAQGEGPAEAAEAGFNPAVARSLTERADGSPCADRGPNIVCSPHQGGCDGGGKGALVQTEKSGTLGTGNDQTIFTPTPINLMVATRHEALGRGTGFGVGQPGDPANTISAAHSHGVFALAGNDKTIFCLQGNGIDRADTAGCNGKGWREDACYTLNTIDRPAVCAEVRCLTPWEAQSARVYDQDGVWHSLNANENGGMARDSVLCAGFKAGQGARAGGIGYSEEVAPTLAAAPSGTNQTPAVVAPVAYSFDSLSSNSMKSKNPHSGCREVEVAKTLDTTDPTPSKNQGGIAVVAPAVMAFATNQREEVRDIGEKSVALAAEPGMHCQTFVAQKLPEVALDMTHACDVIRECGEQVPALQARMGTGGNQVPLTYSRQAIGEYKESSTGSTCSARDFKDSTDIAITNMVVRRLTPMECERLQGFPDHWTDIGEWTDEKGKKHKDADSPRYKALGNSIALPFWDWMLRRMARYLPEGATLGSLFDGIAGFPLIWERIHGKGTARWASEIEQFPIAVTKKHFPEEE